MPSVKCEKKAEVKREKKVDVKWFYICAKGHRHFVKEDVQQTYFIDPKVHRRKAVIGKMQPGKSIGPSDIDLVEDTEDRYVRVLVDDSSCPDTYDDPIPTISPLKTTESELCESMSAENTSGSQKLGINGSKQSSVVTSVKKTVSSVPPLAHYSSISLSDIPIPPEPELYDPFSDDEANGDSESSDESESKENQINVEKKVTANTDVKIKQDKKDEVIPAPLTNKTNTSLAQELPKLQEKQQVPQKPSMPPKSQIPLTPTISHGPPTLPKPQVQQMTKSQMPQKPKVPQMTKPQTSPVSVTLQKSPIPQKPQVPQMSQKPQEPQVPPKPQVSQKPQVVTPIQTAAGPSSSQMPPQKPVFKKPLNTAPKRFSSQGKFPAKAPIMASPSSVPDTTPFVPPKSNIAQHKTPILTNKQKRKTRWENASKPKGKMIRTGAPDHSSRPLTRFEQMRKNEERPTYFSPNSNLHHETRASPPSSPFSDDNRWIPLTPMFTHETRVGKFNTDEAQFILPEIPCFIAQGHNKVTKAIIDTTQEVSFITKEFYYKHQWCINSSRPLDCEMEIDIVWRQGRKFNFLFEVELEAAIPSIGDQPLHHIKINAALLEYDDFKGLEDKIVIGRNVWDSQEPQYCGVTDSILLRGDEEEPPIDAPVTRWHKVSSSIPRDWSQIPCATDTAIENLYDTQGENHFRAKSSPMAPRSMKYQRLFACDIIPTSSDSRFW